MSKNHTIASISVSASASINNINNNSNKAEGLKGLIIAGHDGAKDYGAGEYGLTFGFNWGEYNIFVSRTYGMWLVSLYKNYKSEWTSEGRKISYDAQILDRRLGDYARGKRWSMSLAENMAKFILDAIANYEQDEQDAFQQFCNTFATYGDVQDAFNTITERIADDYGSYLNDLYGDDFRAFLDGEQAWGQCGDCGDEQFENFAMQQGISLADEYGRVYGDRIMHFVVRHYLMEMYDNETLVGYLMDTYDYLCPTLGDVVGLIPNTDGDLIWAADADTISEIEHSKYVAEYGA